jgi:hypothetical protein
MAVGVVVKFDPWVWDLQPLDNEYPSHHFRKEALIMNGRHKKHWDSFTQDKPIKSYLSIMSVLDEVHVEMIEMPCLSAI